MLFCYKVHILADAAYELPPVVEVTAGNVHDSKRATPPLRQARYATTHFWPRYVLADAAYSSQEIRSHIPRTHPGCEAVIDPNAAHKRAPQLTPDLKVLYRQRTAAERVNSRLKRFVASITFASGVGGRWWFMRCSRSW